jgi:hypothetical protein
MNEVTKWANGKYVTDYVTDDVKNLAELHYEPAESRKPRKLLFGDEYGLHVAVFLHVSPYDHVTIVEFWDESAWFAGQVFLMSESAKLDFLTSGRVQAWVTLQPKGSADE